MKRALAYIKYFTNVVKAITEGLETTANNWPVWPADTGTDDAGVHKKQNQPGQPVASVREPVS